MTMTRLGFIATSAMLACGWAVGAQQTTPPRPPIAANDPQFDQTAVSRGQEFFVSQCGFCHGSSARGGTSGPDLTRSELVQSDEGGKQLGVFLRDGRPDQGMPSFTLTPGQATDLATFLHAVIFQNANRRLYQVLDILVGNAK